MALAREPSPPSMPHSIQSYQGSSVDGGDNESVMSDLSWDGTPDENILSGSSRAATSLTIREEDEDPCRRFLDDRDGDHTLIMDEDVYSQLAEMEEKLKMAGEFGNALLEENQDLRLAQQQIQQEMNGKVEGLEQERYELRMKLETARAEQESMSYDRKMEVEALRKELADQDSVLKTANSNKRGVIGELMEQKDQNQKLMMQLHEVTMERDMLHDRSKQLERQNEAISLFNPDSRFGKMEQLQSEAIALRADKKKLEDRVIVLFSEHETMMCNLEEAKERNMMLEKQVVELEQRVQFRETELRDLHRLHEDTLQELGEARSRANTHSSSLFDELEMAELTGYESSDEDLEADQVDMMMSRSLRSRSLSREMSLADELAESSQKLSQNQEMSLADELAELNNAPGQDNATSLADELSEFTNVSMPNRKLNSSNTLVALGYVDEDEEDEDGMGLIELGVAMATQCPCEGMSLADELANTGYNQNDLQNEEEDIGDVEGNDEDDLDLEVINLETPKASPSRSPIVDQFQIKYRLSEEVLHTVHVALTQIIIDLHSLVRLPISDLHIMHTSTMLHSVASLDPMTIPHQMVSRGEDYEDDYDVGGASGREDEGPMFIGEKVRAQLSMLRSILSIVVNGSPKMLSVHDRGHREDKERIGQLEGHTDALRQELGDTQLQVDLLEAEIVRLDKMLLRKDEQIHRLQQKNKLQTSTPKKEYVVQIKEEEGEGERRGGGGGSGRGRARRVSMDQDNQIIHQLQQERDDAIARRNAAEVELENLDSQLLGVVNKKLALSQELDDWQVDMQELLDDHIKHQLTVPDAVADRPASPARSGSKSSPKTAHKKLFGFWS